MPFGGGATGYGGGAGGFGRGGAGGGFGGPGQMAPAGYGAGYGSGFGGAGAGGFGGAAYGGYGYRGGFRGGMHAPRRRKQFVGGSLESQREWEQQNLCCFYLQGLCKFADRCRYSHDDDGTKGCQFGLSCRVGHASRNMSSKPEEQQHGNQVPAGDAPSQ